MQIFSLLTTSDDDDDAGDNNNDGQSLVCFCLFANRAMRVWPAALNETQQADDTDDALQGANNLHRASVSSC